MTPGKPPADPYERPPDVAEDLPPEAIVDVRHEPVASESVSGCSSMTYPCLPTGTLSRGSHGVAGKDLRSPMETRRQEGVFPHGSRTDLAMFLMCPGILSLAQLSRIHNKLLAWKGC